MPKSTGRSATKEKYHHGDLQPALIAGATQMIEQQGVEALSLRKLAEHCGVSRTAAYHHFKDKNDLLCAVAAKGFERWRETVSSIFEDTTLSDEQRFRQFTRQYIKFASQNPDIYDLMFGRTIWKDSHSTSTLKDVAYPSFQFQVEMTKRWQQLGLLSSSENSLRLAQVTWGTLHGIARLLIDGIYDDPESVDEMCQCAANVFLSQQ